MIPAVVFTGTESVFKELLVSEQENQQIYREQTKSNFDQRIAELKGQVDLLKQEAKKIGTMAIFNFVVGLVTVVLNTLSTLFSAAQSAGTQLASKILAAVSEFIGKLQELINGLEEKEKIEIPQEIVSQDENITKIT